MRARHLFLAAFMFSWAIASEELVATFVNFLCHIVSANSCFLVPSFRVLVRNLCPPGEPLCCDRCSCSNGVVRMVLSEWCCPWNHALRCDAVLMVARVV